MPKVITDKKRISELLSRGVEQIYPSREKLAAKLLSGDRLRLYCGYDPTAPSLHIGNAITINKLAQFQALGHEVIFLVGDFTGLIGDPSDKKSARRKMTREEVLANARNYQKQASAYLKFDGPNPARLMYNSAWNDTLDFSALIELASHFTVQQLIQRDMFQARLAEEKPIYLHEFLYPLTQAYDSVAMDVDLEVGGNDQMFNMMCGRDLLRSLKNKEKFVLTLKLLADGEGQKMGKSEGNAVFLDNEAEDMYGKIMSWPDSVLHSAFELCTTRPLMELEQMERELAAGANPRDFKMELAWEITQLSHGRAAADRARAAFVHTFQKKETPEEMESWPAPKGKYALVDLLVAAGLAKSKTEARSLIEQGAIKIQEGGNLVVVRDIKQELLIKKEMVIARGKRQFIRIIR